MSSLTTMPNTFLSLDDVEKGLIRLDLACSSLDGWDPIKNTWRVYDPVKTTCHFYNPETAFDLPDQETSVTVPDLRYKEISVFPLSFFAYKGWLKSLSPSVATKVVQKSLDQDFPSAFKTALLFLKQMSNSLLEPVFEGEISPCEALFQILNPYDFSINFGLLEISALLALGANPHAQYVGKTTLLHQAAKKGHKDAVAVLLKVGSLFNAQNLHGRTPLHLAAKRGHKEAVTLLLNVGANPNIQDKEGKTSLHQAVWNKHIETIEALLKAGANPNIQDNLGSTPLYVAEKKGDQKIIRVLRKTTAKTSTSKISSFFARFC